MNPLLSSPTSRREDPVVYRFLKADILFSSPRWLLFSANRPVSDEDESEMRDQFFRKGFCEPLVLCPL